MADLLNEDEFIHKTYYNPWPVFGIFYAMAFVQVLIVRMIIALTYGMGMIMGFVNLFATLVLCLTLFIHKNEMLRLPWRKKLLGILGLLSVYVIATFTIEFVNYGAEYFIYAVKQSLIAGANYLVILTFCCIAIYIVQRSKQRNGKL
ncbi:hypothetical protein FMM05_15015 [Flavobacterium zepuense]|uniref:Uncharacterized protein n=1 Tax=Flavobacterium zepuense TaxID=2593302 RepID=A0A552UXR8_9FLAO|nr:hypothetical protein [Flavobacterium zepuense]TRW23005.1 hypothetical protein FMM05_15015 [Flavobacterium zepuense]